VRRGGAPLVQALGVVVCAFALFATWSWSWWASTAVVLLAGVVVIPIGYALTIFEEAPY
jgi:hypothetical protein